MDIIKSFPTEICEMIFGHLNFSDLLNATAVCKGWNSFIGSSTVWANVVLGLRADWNDYNDENRKVLSSGRIYQNVLISDGSQGLDFVIDIMSRGKRWKSVKICDVIFEKSEDFVKLFQTFEKTVERVEMLWVRTSGHRIINTDFHFEQLKSLKISNCNEYIWLDVFRHCCPIESLRFEADFPLFLAEIDVKKKFKQMTKLKSLHIYPEIFQNATAADISELTFKLEKLHISNYVMGPNYPFFRRSLMPEFIRMHTNTLKTLYIADCYGTEMMQLPFELKILKKLTFMQLSSSYEWNTPPFETSTSIESLDLTTFVCNGYEPMILKFLKAVPNLKKLRIVEINSNIASFIAEHMKLLRTIKVISVTDEVLKMLPNIVFKLS